jgi:ADP-ribose pyrophosphatase YjhB (NUDIX family)
MKVSPRTSHGLRPFSFNVKRVIICMLLAAAGTYLLLHAVFRSQPFGDFRSSSNKYPGAQYWKKGVTQGYQTIYESAFARFQIHQVLLEDGKTVIKDWLWFDECNNINLLVENQDSTFTVLRQTKYAIEGSTYAIVGGLIEAGEQPREAAMRELKEELGMVSDQWVDLGSYRAAANRGGGMTHTFLARQAVKIPRDQRSVKEGATVEGELERQDVVLLTRTQLVEALLSGMFKEIKWTATVALALLRTESNIQPQEMIRAGS